MTTSLQKNTYHGQELLQDCYGFEDHRKHETDFRQDLLDLVETEK